MQASQLLVACRINKSMKTKWLSHLEQVKPTVMSKRNRKLKKLVLMMSRYIMTSIMKWIKIKHNKILCTNLRKKIKNNFSSCLEKVLMRNFVIGILNICLTLVWMSADKKPKLAIANSVIKTATPRSSLIITRPTTLLKSVMQMMVFLSRRTGSTITSLEGK